MEGPLETYETARRTWPIVWSAVWVGALASLTLALLIGLLGFAFGAHERARFVTWSHVKLITIIFNVCGAFFAFVVGGWVAARIADFRRSEPAMIHGSFVWLLTVPLLLALAGLGVVGHLGGWYGGLAGTPVWTATPPPIDPEVAKGLRNTALATVAALLLGLAGSVLGAWMASGEPMSVTYYRRRGATHYGPRKMAA